VRAEVYTQRGRAETSLMARGIFAAAARESLGDEEKEGEA
jgi:hypothetical protein